MRIHTLSLLFFLLLSPALCFPIFRPPDYFWKRFFQPQLVGRQVAQQNSTVEGNNTNVNGTFSPTNGQDGNGVGYAGTGNDIDTGIHTPSFYYCSLTIRSFTIHTFTTLFHHTPSPPSQLTPPVFLGDDFDIGDGNLTLAPNSSLEIGDRITNINLPLNMSEILAAGISRGFSTNATGGRELTIDIAMRMTISERGGERNVTLGGEGGR